MPRPTPVPANASGAATLPDPAELARLRANLTEILGEPNLTTLEPAWLAKMLNGVIVTLSIGRLGCRAHLTDQDLGIAPRKRQRPARRRAWYARGEPLLLPRRYAAAL